MVCGGGPGGSRATSCDRGGPQATRTGCRGWGRDTGWDHVSQRSEVTEAEKEAGQEQCRKDPGMTRPPPKTTTTTQHQTAGGRRGRGSNEELKEKQNKVKLTAVNTMNQILQESGVRKREI